ncbi:MAG: response regulator [Acidobacteria bacterium]|nr:response regulator [Acidobacteriota bacterium]
MPDVLLIDDSPVQLHVREAVLRSAGFSVLTATSAEQAIKLLHDEAVSSGLRVIVTDHVLPGARGDSFVRELRSLRHTVPVVVVTGMHDAEPEYAGLEIIFLHKPCPPEHLILRIRQAIDRVA